MQGAILSEEVQLRLQAEGGATVWGDGQYQARVPRRGCGDQQGIAAAMQLAPVNRINGAFGQWWMKRIENDWHGGLEHSEIY